MPFSITGHIPDDGTRTETRLLAGSAGVLAMKWIAKGWDVVITDNVGRQYDLDSFRQAVARRRYPAKPF